MFSLVTTVVINGACAAGSFILLCIFCLSFARALLVHRSEVYLLLCMFRKDILSINCQQLSATR